jgi:hypothetical protein
MVMVSWGRSSSLSVDQMGGDYGPAESISNGVSK